MGRYLSTDDMVKGLIRKNGDYHEAGLREVLEYAMPRYVWVVSALKQGRRSITFFVDATGLAQDMNVFLAIAENQQDSDIVKVCREIAVGDKGLKLNPFAHCIRGCHS